MSCLFFVHRNSFLSWILSSFVALVVGSQVKINRLNEVILRYTYKRWQSESRFPSVVLPFNAESHTLENNLHTFVLSNDNVLHKFCECVVNWLFYSQEFDWNELNLSHIALEDSHVGNIFCWWVFPLTKFSGAIKLYNPLFWTWMLLISWWPMTALQFCYGSEDSWTVFPSLKSRNNFYFVRQILSYNASLQKI